MLLIRPGFISPSQCEELITLFQRVAAAPEPADGYVFKMANRTEIAGQLLKRAGNEELCAWFSEVRQQTVETVLEFYGVSEAYHIDFTLVTEMRTGDAHRLHADNEQQDPEGHWVPNHTPWRDYTAMLYLNTSGVDYEGGLLRFPLIRQEIVPQAGLLVGFTCGRQHQHDVTPIQNGSRFAVSIWITRDPWYAEQWE